jgi:hypothetical protein
MNNSDIVFDPSLTMPYCQQLDNKSGLTKTAEIENRHLFYYLNQPANNPEIVLQAFNFIKQNLQQVKQAYLSSFIKEYDTDKLELLKAPKVVPIDASLGTRGNLITSLKQTAAIQLTQSCWLQNIPQTFSSQATIAVQIMSIYKQLSGAGQGNVDLAESYRSLLLELGIHVPELQSYAFSQQHNVMPEIFGFSCIQLALARFPRVFFPEILGFTLACCQMASLFEICFPDHQLSSNYFKLRQDEIEKQRVPLEQCISTYLALFSEQKEIIWQRIQLGFWLYHQQIQLCRNKMGVLLEAPKSSSLAMAQLIQQKAIAAIGHHKNIQLDGKPLNTWFAELPENSSAFLEALKRSKYIDKKTPANSLLLKLFDFKGPMFGVLNETEVVVLKKWLEHGINELSETHLVEAEKPIVKTELENGFRSDNHYAKLSNRSLYYYLVNGDIYPDVLPFARRKLVKLLRICCFFNSLPFKHYSHQQFDRYITELYQWEMRAYEPLQGKPTISKAAYLWGLEQIAPMILIDGCWLQKSLDLQHSYPGISEILFSIYCDELGNGQLEQNHPYIFQQLLDSLSIQVPLVYKKEFIEHTGFINSAFDLPVYMLSLANYSIEFLPELLGLNMAIELSGLGKHYMRLVDDWNYWGIDPTIASIHISIDNVASGHTFLAKKAIQDYMDEIFLKTADHAVVDQHWRRIYTGYSSLRFVAGRFKFSVPIGYFINKFRRKFRLANV